MPFYNSLKSISRYKFLYIIASPAFILTLVFCYIPMSGLIMAFQEYDIIGGIGASEFVGFENFVKIFTMPKFLHAIKNTLIYSSVNLFFGTPFPIVLALLFNELRKLWFKKVVQTISYLPYFLSWISVVGIIYGIFAKDGSFNDIMQSIFGEGYVRTNILMDSKYFLGVVFWSNIWKNIGWSSIIYLAAISGIDQSLYEAAKIDGCGRLKQVFYITFPSILPTIAILFIMSTATLVHSNFEQVFGLQNVYTQEDTEVINTLVFRRGIENGEYSLATAFGLFQGAASFGILYLSNKIIKKLTGIGIW